MAFFHLELQAARGTPRWSKNKMKSGNLIIGKIRSNLDETRSHKESLGNAKQHNMPYVLTLSGAFQLAWKLVVTMVCSYVTMSQPPGICVLLLAYFYSLTTMLPSKHTVQYRCRLNKTTSTLNNWQTTMSPEVHSRFYSFPTSHRL